MSELKTKLNDADPRTFIESVDDPQRRADCLELLDTFQKLTGYEPKMWGGSIVGYGSYHYKSKSGREGDWMLTGFSPREQYLSVYVMSGFDLPEDYLSRLGKFKNGKSCLNINKLDDIDREVLNDLVVHSVDFMKSYDHIH